MNTKMNKRLSITTLVVATMISGVIGFNYVMAEQTEESPNNGIGLRISQDDLLAEDGINSAVTIKADEKDLSVERGTSMWTTLTITHEVNDVSANDVTLEARGIKGVYIPQSKIDTSSTQDRVNEFRQTGTIQGSVDLSQFVTYSPNKVTVPAGESAQIRMQIHVPADVPSELVDKEIDFRPDIHRIGSYAQQTVGIFNESTITVSIGE